MSNAAATVTQASPAHPPIMSVGKITMENLAEFKNCTRRHFAYKAIPAEGQVAQVLFCFDDHSVSAWIAANNEMLIELTFKNFILHLRAEYTAKNTSSEGGQASSLDNIEGLNNWCTAVGHIDDGL
ncbi:hypothetical protein C0991_001385 [Blastosporella zonata]|nr:hypothetical protein C0991_001385 [Blastosporella zonata]